MPELISDLKALRKSVEGDNHDVVIHTSINKAIPTMPDVGIDAQELKDIGFRLVLVGITTTTKRSFWSYQCRCTDSSKLGRCWISGWLHDRKPGRQFQSLRNQCA